MRVAALIIGLIGGFIGFVISSLNLFSEIIFISSGTGKTAYAFIEAVLLLFSLAAIVGAIATVWRPRLGSVLLGASACGILVLGYLQLPRASISEILQYVSPIVAPIIATPLLLVATILAFVATRNDQSAP